MATKNGDVKEDQVTDLIYQALETELGGAEIYKVAVDCAVNEDVKEEWQKYGEETQMHQRVVRDLMARLGLDPEKETPGRKVVRHTGEALVAAMQMAKKASPVAGQLVAAECIVMAETKDHANWELIGELSKKMTGDRAKALKEAYDQVEEQEDMHLYHTMGWARELWMESLGLPAVLPPPEEEQEVTTMKEAAEAKESRKSKVRKTRAKTPSRGVRKKKAA
jgi:hypothetical protein